MKILYVHGYAGHGDGDTSRLLRRTFEENGLDVQLDAPQIPYMDPAKSREFIGQLIRDNNYDVIIASSLGAFYSMIFAGCKKILVNPASPEDLRGIDAEFVEGGYDVLEAQREAYIRAFDEKLNAETQVMFGAEDNVATHNVWIKERCTNRMTIPKMGHELSAGCAKIIAAQIKVFLGITTEYDEKVYDFHGQYVRYPKFAAKCGEGLRELTDAEKRDISYLVDNRFIEFFTNPSPDCEGQWTKGDPYPSYPAIMNEFRLCVGNAFNAIYDYRSPGRGDTTWTQMREKYFNGKPYVHPEEMIEKLDEFDNKEIIVFLRYCVIYKGRYYSGAYGVYTKEGIIGTLLKKLSTLPLTITL